MVRGQGDLTSLESARMPCNVGLLPAEWAMLAPCPVWPLAQAQGRGVNALAVRRGWRHGTRHHGPARQRHNLRNKTRSEANAIEQVNVASLRAGIPTELN